MVTMQQQIMKILTKEEKQMNDLQEAKQFLSYANISKVSLETGIHKNTLYNIVHGRHIPHLYNIQKILKLKNKGTLAEDAK